MSDLYTSSFKLETRRGDVVWGDVRHRVRARKAPAVVFLHGFKGFKDWGPFPRWGERLAEAGYVAVHVNFSHNGVTPRQPESFAAPDRFARNTLLTELADVQAVLDAVAAGRLGPVDTDRIGLLGHSRGGGIAVLQAGRDRRVKVLVTWAAVAGFIERFTAAQVADWQRHGYTEVVNTRTGETLRLNRTLYDEALDHRRELDVLHAAAHLHVPWLIVHARDDEAVPFAEAEDLHDAAGTATLHEAAGGHTFGGAHPFDGTLPPPLEDVWNRTLAFLDEHL